MEQILGRGAIVDVEVVEVDTDRGRIALKLVGLHEDGNVLSPQDVGERYKLAFPDSERSERPPREDGDRGDRGRRGRDRDRGPRH
jgi:transcriptional accessory protein Tex/SPT6